MNCEKTYMRLYAVTDRSWIGKGSLAQQVEQALKGGVTLVQLREKDLSEEEFLKEARIIKDLCDRYEVPLIINDNVALAKKIGAAGVHVGQGDMEASKVRKILGDNAIIGVSARTPEQALKAQTDGADYLGVGAVFGTTTKADAKPLDRETLQEICEAVSIPVVAIGGVNKENIWKLKGTGVDGVALVSAIFAAEDIEKECRELRHLSDAMVKKMNTALSIAGSDSSGGAGIQADLKTMTMNGVFGMSAITALTAQNTVSVSGIMEVTPEFLCKQLDAVFEDIYPDAVKIGMVSSSELIKVIAERLHYYGARNIVVDPVMVATSGSRLISEEAVETLKECLLPLATVVTPNIPEAEILSGRKIENAQDMMDAAKIIEEKYHCGVMCKGGHSINDANDLLYSDGVWEWFRGKRINNPNTHGTGCTLSSAIASNLAKGMDLKNAIIKAKEYISGALGSMLDLGQGSGPMNHAFLITDR